MLSFGSNIAALAALRRLNNSVEELGKSSQRLASGMRINRASDDAAGLAIASALNKDTRVYSQAIRNGNDAVSALSIAEGSANELTSVLTRLKELAEQSASGTFSRTQRLALDKEGKSLTDEYNRLVASTSFNGLNLLNGTLGRMNIQLGYGSSGSIGADVGSGLQRTVGTGFATAVSRTGGTDIVEHKYADFNNDGILDLVTTNTSDGLAISLGNGDGSFQTPSSPSFKGFTCLDTADLNGDGNMDIITGIGAGIRIFLGNGNATFTTGSVALTGATADTSLALGDFNADGIIDVATSGSSSNQVGILLGDGKGSFTQSLSVDVGTTNTKLKLGDIDGDGRKDLLVGNGGTQLSAFKITGNAQFSSMIDITVGKTGYSSFDVGDFNLDGIDDLIFGMDNQNCRLLIANGDGSFKATVAGSSSELIFSSRAADVDGDGLLDFIAGGSDITVFKGNGDGTFGAGVRSTVSAILDGNIEAADLNGDGVNDISSGSNGTPSVYVSLAQTTTSTGVQRINLTTQENARASLTLLDTMFGRVQKEIGLIGASQSRIASALGNLTALRENSAAAESRIRDVDVASESARMTSLTILRQTGAAVLAQANQAPSLALSLLKSLG